MSNTDPIPVLGRIAAVFILLIVILLMYTIAYGLGEIIGMAALTVVLAISTAAGYYWEVYLNGPEQF